MNVSKLVAVAALFAVLPYVGALAADHKVSMKGTGAQPMVYEPAFLKIAAGDTVTFVPENAGHNAAALFGMVPKGTEEWYGKLDQELTVTFGVEGLHAYKCGPHLYMGMVGLVQVGDTITEIDPAALDELPPKAKSTMKALLAKAGVAVSN